MLQKINLPKVDGYEPTGEYRPPAQGEYFLQYSLNSMINDGGPPYIACFSSVRYPIGSDRIILRPTGSEVK